MTADGAVVAAARVVDGDVKKKTPVVGTLIQAWPEWRVEWEEPSLSRQADHLGEHRSAKEPNTISRPDLLSYI